MGTAPWWHRVRRLRGPRDAIEAFVAEAAALGGDVPNPHGIRASTRTEVGRVIHVAAHLLVFAAYPSYAALMPLPHVWRQAKRPLRAFIAAEYSRILLEGSAEARKWGQYSLEVDFFPVPERAAFMMSRLAKVLPSEQLAKFDEIRRGQFAAAARARSDKT